VSGRRPAIRRSAVATGKGDDGTTGLLFGGPKRISKDDPLTDAYGTVDEAVAALGVARAELARSGADGRSAADGRDGRGTADAEMSTLLLRLQRELFVVGAELATAPGQRSRLQDGVSRVSEPMLDGLEATLAELESRMTMPREFVVPGQTPFSAALELARTIVRRAERRVVGLAHDGRVESAWLVSYLNRLADVLWVLARVAEQAANTAAPRSRG
jgi:cob(I)alamin adenosyltransferase